MALKGFTGCGAFDVRGLVNVDLWRGFELDAGIGEALGTGWAKALEQLEPLLKGHPLERAAGFSGWQGRRWSYRVVW